MKSDSFDEAKLLDNLLFDIAIYDVTGGLIPLVENKKAYRDIYLRASFRFNHFKRLIQLGECTFESIRDIVLARNGPYAQKRQSDEEAVEELLNPSPKARITPKQAKAAIATMEDMIAMLKRNAIKQDEIFDDPEEPEEPGEEN